MDPEGNRGEGGKRGEKGERRKIITKKDGGDSHLGSTERCRYLYRWSYRQNETPGVTKPCESVIQFDSPSPRPQLATCFNRVRKLEAEQNAAKDPTRLRLQSSVSDAHP